MLKRNATSRVVLRETAPGGEIELGGLLDLREIAVEAGTAGQKFEDARLVEDVDLIAPDHVIDGRQFVAVSHQRGGETGHAVGGDGAAGRGLGCDGD